MTLTRREQFALAALTGLLANHLAEPRYSGNLFCAAKDAVEIADELIARLDAPPVSYPKGESA